MLAGDANEVVPTAGTGWYTRRTMKRLTVINSSVTG
jgi:hypothetical protein